MLHAEKNIVQQMILFLNFKSESLNQGLWLQSVCVTDTQNTCRDI